MGLEENHFHQEEKYEKIWKEYNKGTPISIISQRTGVFEKEIHSLIFEHYKKDYLIKNHISPDSDEALIVDGFLEHLKEELLENNPGCYHCSNIDKTRLRLSQVKETLFSDGGINKCLENIS